MFTWYKCPVPEAGIFKFYFIEVVDLQCYVDFFFLYSKVTQLYVYIHIYVFFTIVVCRRILNIVPCAIQ